MMIFRLQVEEAWREKEEKEVKDHWG